MFLINLQRKKIVGKSRHELPLASKNEVSKNFANLGGDQWYALMAVRSLLLLFKNLTTKILWRGFIFLTISLQPYTTSPICLFGKNVFVIKYIIDWIGRILLWIYAFSKIVKWAMPILLIYEAWNFSQTLFSNLSFIRNLVLVLVHVTETCEISSTWF